MTHREVFLGSVVEPLRPTFIGLVLKFLVNAARICLRDNPTLLNPENHLGAGLPSCVTPRLITSLSQFRNINRIPFDYALRPRLRIDLP